MKEQSPELSSKEIVEALRMAAHIWDNQADNLEGLVTMRDYTDLEYVNRIRSKQALTMRRKAKALRKHAQSLREPK